MQLAAAQHIQDDCSLRQHLAPLQHLNRQCNSCFDNKMRSCAWFLLLLGQPFDLLQKLKQAAEDASTSTAYVMRQRKARLQQARQWKAVAKLSAQQLMQITVERSGAEHLHQTEKKQLYDQIASASGDATSASQAKIHDQAEEIRQLKYMLSHAQKKVRRSVSDRLQLLTRH